jgi:glycosyltransferase involved in cell wall biosynthesis
LPTFYSGEGHPGVIVEAMIAGIPVITTAHRSIPEIVKDGFNGLLVPPLDSMGLAQAIHLLNSDRKMLADMGKQNWEMRKNYAASDVVPDILQLMDIQI